MPKVSALDVKRARVTVEIDGEEMTLVPSPGAILVLSEQYDGFGPLIQAIQRLKVSAAADVVIAGLGLEGRAAKEMREKVAMTGVVDLVGKLTEFVMVLANGGRPLTDDEDSKKESDPSRS